MIWLKPYQLFSSFPNSFVQQLRTTMIARAEVADGDTCNKQHYGNSCVYSDISKRKVEKGRVCCPASRQFVFLSLRFPISVSRP